MKEYFIDWFFENGTQRKVYTVLLRGKIASKSIAGFRYRRDAKAFLKMKQEE